MFQFYLKWQLVGHRSQSCCRVLYYFDYKWRLCTNEYGFQQFCILSISNNKRWWQPVTKIGLTVLNCMNIIHRGLKYVAKSANIFLPHFRNVCKINLKTYDRQKIRSTILIDILSSLQYQTKCIFEYTNETFLQF